LKTLEPKYEVQFSSFFTCVVSQELYNYKDNSSSLENQMHFFNTRWLDISSHSKLYQSFVLQRRPLFVSSGEVGEEWVLDRHLQVAVTLDEDGMLQIRG